MHVGSCNQPCWRRSSMGCQRSRASHPRTRFTSGRTFDFRRPSPNCCLCHYVCAYARKLETSTALASLLGRLQRSLFNDVAHRISRIFPTSTFAIYSQIHVFCLPPSGNDVRHRPTRWNCETHGLQALLAIPDAHVHVRPSDTSRDNAH
ncbi:hypothetical protein PISMIDRAFT_447155 [Pisolithus microcarpus 441]|uniref:Uncharacterized protein n=1 Tax=Pisolithus microcarpus 441 TaxID=765257 RepID=A0A0C9ZKS1_9AGAM|nr:hypothetical protein PISMIDRAFT_447155 [Pisolithus microcarpus 441]